jgi:hypothetical protein
MSQLSIGLSLVLLGALSAAPVAASPSSVSGITYHLADALSSLSWSGVKQIRTYNQVDHCLIWEPITFNEAALQKALAHVEKTVRDPQFQAFIKAKRDWTVQKGEPDPAHIFTLLAQPRQVSLFLYERNEEHHCKGPNFTDGDGNTDAFTPLGPDKNSIFVFAPYLDQTRAQKDIEMGVRYLAKTIIHETLHVLGYLHQKADWSASYDSTVPVYVGCATMHWSSDSKDQQWVRNNCGKAHRDQKDARYTLSCASAGETFKVGDTVVHAWLSVKGNPVALCGTVRGKDGPSASEIIFLQYKTGREDAVDSCILRRPKPGECPAK